MDFGGYLDPCYISRTRDLKLGKTQTHTQIQSKLRKPFKLGCIWTSNHGYEYGQPKAYLGVRQPRAHALGGQKRKLLWGVYISKRFLVEVYIAKISKRAQPFIKLQPSSPLSFLFYDPASFHFYTPQTSTFIFTPPIFPWLKRKIQKQYVKHKISPRD